jgi:hypothetical protein
MRLNMQTYPVQCAGHSRVRIVEHCSASPTWHVDNFFAILRVPFLVAPAAATLL